MEINEIVDPHFNAESHAENIKALLFSPALKMSSIDGQSVYMVFLLLNSLDMLDSIDTLLSESERSSLVEWLYLQQIVRRVKGTGKLIGGFRGSESCGFTTSYDVHTSQPIEVECEESNEH